MAGSGIGRDLARNRAVYLMALPGILYFAVFCYVPMPGIVIAFKNYNVRDGVFGSPWNGLANFRFLVLSGDLVRVTLNTLKLNALFIFFGTATQVAFAILLNEVRVGAFKRLCQSFVFFPYFISWVVVGSLAYNLFATDVGFLNSALTIVGLRPIAWYSRPEIWPAVLTGAYIWKWLGWGSIIYLAAISAIDPSLYEAARIDGGSRWVQVRRITLPLLLPTILTLTLLAIGRIFYGDFGLVLNLVKSNALLYKTTDVIDTYVYRAFRSEGGNFASGSAAGVYQSLMGFLVILAANGVVRRIDRDRALF